MFLDWGSGHQKNPALWKVWMSLPALYSMSDDELQRVDHERIIAERHSHEALAEGALYAMSEETLHSMADGERLVAERRAYEASRSGEQKAAFGRMLENTMVSTRQPLSPGSTTTCTALTARWLYIPR